MGLDPTPGSSKEGSGRGNVTGAASSGAELRGLCRDFGPSDSEYSDDASDNGGSSSDPDSASDIEPDQDRMERSAPMRGRCSPIVMRSSLAEGLREHRSVAVLAFPQIATLPKCKLDLYDRVAVCAQDKNARVVIRWLHEVEGPRTWLSDFEESGPGFETLDRKLVAALLRELSGDLALEADSGRRVAGWCLVDRCCLRLTGISRHPRILAGVLG